MAVLRFSAINGFLTHPPESGVLPSSFSAQHLCRFGSQEPLQSSKLQEHIKQQIDEYMNGGVNLGPIVFLIHGNDFNPLDRNVNAFHSANPHLRVFHPRGYAWKKPMRLHRFSWVRKKGTS